MARENWKISNCNTESQMARSNLAKNCVKHVKEGKRTRIQTEENEEKYILGLFFVFFAKFTS